MATGTPRNPWHIFTAVAGFGVTGWYIHTLAPTSWYIVTGLLIVLFTTLYFFLLFLLNTRRRAFFLTSALVGIAALRMLGLKDILYVLFLIAVLVLLNLYFGRK